MEEGVCTKQFPKPFQDATDITEDGYPKYRRRDNRNDGHVVRRHREDRNVDNAVRAGHTHNGFVVPYNAFLSKTFDAHINVEMCHQVPL